ncbi:MAG TPA: dTDP-4-dehydrorhamnose reductase [Candidatus Dormibacteraeota bacterium]
MRILVLGAGGQLGVDLAAWLDLQGHEVTTRDRAQLDIVDASAVGEAVARGGYQRVVNCAAYTRVDEAERERALAFLVNQEGAGNVARACARAGVALCHLSTDFVFTQPPPEPARPWSESDQPQPQGVYAESKRAGELECLAAQGPLYLVRTSWLYGGAGPNFPIAICRAAARGVPLRVVADQLGSPTWTGHLVRALGDLLEGEELGLYHLTGSGATTWFHFAKAVLQEVGVAAPVEPTTTAAWGAAAPRPQYSVLDNGHWRRLGKAPLPAWEEGLLEYVAAERGRALAEFRAAPGSE